MDSPKSLSDLMKEQLDQRSWTPKKAYERCQRVGYDAAFTTFLDDLHGRNKRIPPPRLGKLIDGLELDPWQAIAASYIAPLLRFFPSPRNTDAM